MELTEMRLHHNFFLGRRRDLRRDWPYITPGQSQHALVPSIGSSSKNFKTPRHETTARDFKPESPNRRIELPPAQHLQKQWPCRVGTWPRAALVSSAPPPLPPPPESPATCSAPRRRRGDSTRPKLLHRTPRSTPLSTRSAS